MSPVNRPLVLTADEQLLDDVLRLAAAAGVEVDLVTEVGAARARWPGAPLVVVGDDQAGQLLAIGPPRRQGVVLVCVADDGAATWRRAVGLGAERVVRLPAEESSLVDAFADVAEGADAQRAVVLGVVGGRGGAGASVLAAALAMTGAHRKLVTMLIDADPHGGGLDLVMGAEHSGGLRWPDLADTRGRVSGATLRGHLPEPHGLTVLSWDRGEVLGVPPEAIKAVTTAACRSWDLVVLDLPRRVDAATEEALAACGCVLLVVPAEVRAVAAASRVAAGIGVVAADVRVVVRRPAPSGLRPTEVARALGLPLAADIDVEPGLAEALERGEPPCRSGSGPLAGECGRLLDEFLAAEGTRAA